MDDFDYDILEKRIKNETDRKIFQKVFDSATLKTIHLLATKGLFETLEYIISTGKEAHVFVATDLSGNKRAVKIYKIETSDFKNMKKYIEGDIRFKEIRKEKRQIVFIWTKKEFKNLLTASNKKLSVPLPLGFKDNVLVMEFIGHEEASPKLKDIELTKEQAETYYQEVIEFMAKLYLAGLVHADLSEYNILVRDEKLIFIDIGQAVVLTHPNAKEFFERDVNNIALFFAKRGVKTDFETLYAQIKAYKDKISTI